MAPRSVQDYLSQLQALLPRGLAWSKAPDATLTKTLHAVASELARLDYAAHTLPEETNPASTINGLEDWERVLGLPDECLPAGTSLQERRGAVLSKLRDTGRQDLTFWQELACTLGYEVIIEEHWPFICGWHECGNPQAGYEISGMEQEEWEQAKGYPIGRCGSEEMRYWLNVIVKGDRLIHFRCAESACPENLLNWKSAHSLECVMQRDKEAHILLTFEYLEEEQ